MDISKFSKYDAGWKIKFEAEKARIFDIFKDQFVKIEHIGSTAIPGLSAKPIIDIAVLIGSIADRDEIAKKLNVLGYEYKPTMSSGERIFLRKGDPVEYHLSIACPDHTFWSRNILFRDCLIKHPEFIKEYENLKLENLKKVNDKDLEDLSLSETYNQGKGEFVKKVLDLADLENASNVKYFIAIPILGEPRDRIIKFQKRFLKQGSVIFAEPHVTIKASGGLTPDEAWIQKVKEVVAGSNSFTLSLEKIETFGNKVVILKAEPFNVLFNLHKAIVEELDETEEDIKKYHELGSYYPHSTLFEVEMNEDHSKFLEVLGAAKEVFDSEEVVQVSKIRVYKQDIPDVPYRKLVDIELSNS